jgi:small subunit ribosomal protein S20
MANTSSAKKAIRVTARKTVINLRTRRAFKEARKAVLKAIAEKDKKTAQSLLPSAYKAIDKAAKANVLHKNTAGRYKAGLAKSIKGLK